MCVDMCVDLWARPGISVTAICMRVSSSSFNIVKSNMYDWLPQSLLHLSQWTC